MLYYYKKYDNIDIPVTQTLMKKKYVINFKLEFFLKYKLAINFLEKKTNY